MKPFPQALQTLRPVPPDVLPERPWWRRGEFDGRFTQTFRRSDGRLARTLEEVATIDAETPLTHPGFRVSQVWASIGKEGRIYCVSIVLQNDREWRLGDGTWLAPSGQAETGGPIAIDDWFSRSLLLADPQCPHLAPWAPVETK